jgi:predicted metal-dependent peptidase
MFALDMELTPEQRLFRELTRVLDHDRYAALAGVAQLGEVRVEEGVRTAYTNFKDIVFGKEFISTLPDDEIRGCIIHELYHIGYMHAANYLWMHERDPRLANIVWDYRINGQIIQENRADGFAKLPEGALYESKYDGLLEGDIWKLLYEEQQKSDGPVIPPPSGEGEGEGEGEGDPEDETEEEGEGEAEGEGEDEQGSMDEHDVDAFNEMSEEEQRELVNDVQEAIRQGLLAAEKSGRGSNKSLEALVEVVIPWEDIVQEWFTETCSGGEDGTFRVPNRKYMPMDIIRPSRIQDKLNDIVLGIDTSGSCASPKELTKFMSVVRSIIETLAINKVHVLYWDTEVRGHETYGEADIPLSELVNTTMPKGGGGTQVECVPEYIKQNNIQAEGVVVLTDGDLWGGWGTWASPVLWAVLNNKQAKPSVGKKLDVLL